MQEAKSRIEQVIDLCTEGKFTGVLRVDSAVAQGEIQFFSGIRDEVRFGISTGAEALARMIQAPSPRCDAIPSLPNPRGGFKKGLPPQGPLSEMRGMDLMHYCETFALTCTLELTALGRNARASYRIGELASIELVDDKPGGDAVIADLLQATEGTYQFTLPPFELPESFRTLSQRPAKPQDWLQNLVGGDGVAPTTTSRPPAAAPRETAVQATGSDAARSPAGAAETQRAAEARALADREAQRRAADEADAKRRNDEARKAAEGKRKAEEARAAETARAAEAARLASVETARKAEAEAARVAQAEAERAEEARLREAETAREREAEATREREAEVLRAAEAEIARKAEAEASRVAAADKVREAESATASGAAAKSKAERAGETRAGATKGAKLDRPSDSVATSASGRRTLGKDRKPGETSPPTVAGPSLTVVLVVVIILLLFLLLMRLR